MTRRIAAFDVDGTLTTTDCVVPFMRRAAGTPRLIARLALHPVSLAMAVLRRDRDALKAMSSMAAFAGRTVADVDAMAAVFAREVFDHRLRADVVSQLEAHRRAGDTVLLVSASFEVYLRPLGDLLGVDDVLAVRLAADFDGRLTGALAGANCRGQEKVARLHAWLDAHAGGRAAVHLTAYGDSPGDRELLADADDARWVGTKTSTRGTGELRSPSP